MDACLTCSGAILEPGIAYGYAGPVCYCQREPRIQKRRSNNPFPSPGSMQFEIRPAWADEIIKRIETIEKKLTGESK